jgi:hypothetical protein
MTATWTECSNIVLILNILRNLSITKPQGAECFTVTGSFRLTKILLTVDHQDSTLSGLQIFPLKTGLPFAQVPFKTGFVIYNQL